MWFLWWSFAWNPSGSSLNIRALIRVQPTRFRSPLEPFRRRDVWWHQWTHVFLSEHEVFKHCFAGLVTCVEFLQAESFVRHYHPSWRRHLCAGRSKWKTFTGALTGVASEECRCGFHRVWSSSTWSKEVDVEVFICPIRTCRGCFSCELKQLNWTCRIHYPSLASAADHRAEGAGFVCKASWRWRAIVETLKKVSFL